MSRDSHDISRSPFAPAPSARPPSAAELRVQVRVPPPPRAMENAELESITAPEPRAAEASNAPGRDLAPEITEPATTPSLPPASPPLDPRHDGSVGDEPWMVGLPGAPTIAAEHPMPDPDMAAAPPPHRWRARLGALLAASALLTVVIAVLGARLLESRHETPSATPSIAPAATEPVSSAAAAETPGLVPSATSAPMAAAPEPQSSAALAPTASAAASNATKPTPAAKPFDNKSARTALDALVPKLAACKLPKGASWTVNVTFAPDGHVTSTVPTGKHAAAQSTCVTAQLKKATIAPFAGSAKPYAFTFVAGNK